MSAVRRPRRRLPAGARATLATLVAVACGVGVWQLAVRIADPAPAAVAAAGGDAMAVAPVALELPDHPTVLVFGDSWTYGSAAASPALGYAAVVGELAGWTTVVDGVRGSGYLTPGIDGPDYATRIAALDPRLDPDLVIVQGSINDRREPAAGYRQAVDAAWDALADRLPRAQVVVLGPAPQVLPVEAATARIDADLAAAAAARGWWYISPIRERWITPANYAQVIDAGAGRQHPSTAGHRYLAERLAAAVAALQR